MTRRSQRGEVSRCAARLWWPCIAVLASLAPSNGRADDFSGRATLGYLGNDSDTYNSRAFNQLYDLRLQRELSDPLHLRMSLRYEDARGSNVGLQQTASNASRVLQPTAALTYSLRPVDVDLGYDLTYSDSHAQSVLTDRRELQRAYARFSIRADDLPGLSVYADRHSSNDTLTTTQQTETNLSQQADYAWRGLKFGQSMRYGQLDDATQQFRRSTVEALGRIDYEGAFPLLPAGSITASNQVTFSRMEEVAVAGTAVAVPNPVLPTRGLYSRDEHPGTSPGVPMTSLGALIDGNLTVSAGISLGPDGLPFQNVGVDMGRYVALDQVRVHVRGSAGNLVPAGGAVIFDVFTSVDGSTWLPLAGAATQYNTALSYYEIDFPTVTARFLKVVSFGNNTYETLVTEMQTYVLDRLNPQQTRTTPMLLDAFAAALTTRPWSALTLRYNALVNALTQQPSGGERFSSFDSDQIISAVYTPSTVVALDGRYQRRNVAQTGGLTQSAEIVTAIAQVMPIREYRTALTLTRTDEDSLGKISHTNQVSLYNYLLLLPTLDLAIDTGFSRQLWPSDYQRADRLYASGMSVARLTTALTLTLTASTQRSSTLSPLTSTADLVLPVTHQEQYAAEAFYRPSSQVNLSARLGYSVADLYSGLIQRYRVYWNPFPGGSVQIGGTYDQNVDAIAQMRSWTANGFVRWRVNSHTALDATYNTIHVQNHTSYRSNSFGLTMTLNV